MAKKRTEEDIYEDFDINEDGVLIRYTGSGREITVPESVKIIGPKVFCGFGGRSTVTKVTIPEGVEILQQFAFSGSDIEKISLPSTLKIIGECAFSGCIKLRSITIPEGVRVIDEQAFEDSGLEEIVLPKSLRVIGRSAFSGCGSLKTVILPEESHPRIDNEAFFGCRELLDENGFVIIHNRIVYFEPDHEESPLYVTIPENAASIEGRLFSRYPVVHLTMSLDCPSWAAAGSDIWDVESIITNDGSSISFTDTDGKTAAKVILAIRGERECCEESVIISIHPKLNASGFDFDAYDGAFSKIERIRNKAVMALVRLVYPYELSEIRKDTYVSFLKENILDVLIMIFEERLAVLGMEDFAILKVLEEKGILEDAVIGDLIRYANRYSRNDFVMELLEYQNKTFRQKNICQSLELTDDPSESSDADSEKPE